MDGIRAIADPVRREILELLRESPLPAGTIAEHFAVSRPAISRHLKVLLECGAVAVTETGRQRVYGLRARPFVALTTYLQAFTAPPFAQRLDALGTEVARTRRERERAGTASRSVDAVDDERKRSA